MKKNFIFINLFLILLFVLLFGSFNFTFAQSEKIQIDFFYSAICPHCKAEKEFLNTLKEKYSELEINEYEIFYSTDNQKILNEFYGKYNVPNNEQGYVPIIFTPTKYFIGFNEQIRNEIESCIKECIGQGDGTVSQKIKVPFIGEVDVSKISLPVLTLILGILDGFNPCAMWVLVILISLLLSLKSRKKIALVGIIFIFAGGLLYFLFMSAWLNTFLFIGSISLIRILIGVFGIIFGIWRLRDFVIWKPGVCKVTENTKSQGKIMERINNILKPTVVPATILGVFALAFSVNLVEFLCSAGFPVMYTKILASQGLETIQYYIYLFFYNIFYMLDDFIVFSFAFFTLSRFGFSDKYNRYSTLVAGILILILGILIIFKPSLLMFG